MPLLKFLGTYKIGSGATSRCPGIGGAGRQCVAFLFQNPNHYFDRDELVDRFWYSEDCTGAKSLLNSTASRLRQALKPNEMRDIELRSDKWSMGIYMSDPTLTDTGGLAEVYRSLLSNDGDVRRQFQNATDLYRGDFLPGYTNHWTLIERERMLGLYVRTILLITDRLFQEGAHAEAVEGCRNILEHDRLRESALRRMMLLWALRGEGVKMRQYFRKFCSQVREECDAAPTRRTQSLYEALCRDPTAQDFDDIIAQELATR